jgi:translation initiation factor IF-1
MGEDESIEVQGVVIETLPNAEFNVELKNGHRLLGRVSRKMKPQFIRILPGDVVTITLSPDDLNRGKIVYRAPS